MNETNEKQEKISSKYDGEKVPHETSPETSSTSKTKDEEKEKHHIGTKRKYDDTEQNLNDGSNSIIDNCKKMKASQESTVDSNNTVLIAKHYNSQAKEGNLVRNQSRIFHMRNFNNWIKSLLIGEYMNKIKENKALGSSINVLDMCCGKGGDLFKWEKAKVTHLICVDLSEVSMEICKQRYNDLVNLYNNRTKYGSLFSAEFITADCTKVHIRSQFKDPSIQLDFVSCQFAFHYCFESLQQAECMLRNASECLKEGGYFVGTLPDAYSLVSRWQKCNEDSFGNEVYNIAFSCNKTKPPLFGAKYHFQLEGVVNCPEFLVYLPVLCKLAKKFGLELVMFKRFDDYYECIKKSGKYLLNKMQGLETYPPYQGAQLVGKVEEDYQHVTEYMKDVSDNRRVGTLTQSEWEVISLYAVFAFKKMKTAWNSQGEPEYVKP